jgi:hypothetical protein
MRLLVDAFALCNRNASHPMFAANISSRNAYPLRRFARTSTGFHDWDIAIPLAGLFYTVLADFSSSQSHLPGV